MERRKGTAVQTTLGVHKGSRTNGVQVKGGVAEPKSAVITYTLSGIEIVSEAVRARVSQSFTVLSHDPVSSAPWAAEYSTHLTPAPCDPSSSTEFLFRSRDATAPLRSPLPSPNPDATHHPSAVQRSETGRKHSVRRIKQKADTSALA